MTAAALAGSAVPAPASTTSGSSPGGVVHHCAFPSLPSQPASGQETFTGPGPVPQGSAFGITPVSGAIPLTI